MTSLSFSQNSSIDVPWSGWAHCQINVQGPGYSHSETHTWTLTGEAPSVQGAMCVHPATWKVTGQGSFSRTQGAQTLSGQWTTTATQNAPLALLVRASDGRLILKAWHSQLRFPAGVVGVQQQSINGVPQSQSAISLEAFEWAFPAVDAVSTSKQISGSNSTATGGAVGPMQPGGSQGTAVCSWQFAAGGNTITSSPPAVGAPQNSTGTGIGTTPTGTNPGAPNAGGPNPTGINPVGTSPAGTNPGGTNPGGLTPPGSPGSPSSSTPGNATATPPANGQTPTPQIMQVSPSGGQQGTQQLKVTITGKDTHFAQGATTLNFGPGIVISSPVVTPPNIVTAQLSIDAAAVNGQRDVTVTTGSEIATLSQAFNVAPTLTATPINPLVKPIGPSGSGCPPSTFSGTSLAHQDFAVGSRPQQLAFDGYNIWVVNQGDGSVTKLRASDGSVLGTYKTRVAQSGTRSAPFGIAFDGANRMWVTLENDESVNMLQASSGSVNGVYQTSYGPAGVAYDGTNLWVTSDRGGVEKLRASDGALLGGVALGRGYSIIFDGANIWVPDWAGNAVTKVRTSDNTNLGRFPTGTEPQGLAFDGTNIWVAIAGGENGVVTKLRASDGANLGTFCTGGAGPVGLAFDGANIWVANTASNTITKLRASDGATLGIFSAGPYPQWVLFADGNVWVTNKNGNTVSKF